MSEKRGTRFSGKVVLITGGNSAIEGKTKDESCMGMGKAEEIL